MNLLKSFLVYSALLSTTATFATQTTTNVVATQNFESFETNQSWYLSDFGLQGENSREDYVSDDSEINFDISWTKRTRNHLADRLGYSRSEMTKELANSICEPKIEFGKASVYRAGSRDNMIAELDTDLQHCGISGNEPANIRIRSFIPTKIGYKYKVKFDYKMRSYGGMTEKSYRNLIVRFGSELEKFDPVFNAFSSRSLEVLATRKFSKLVLRDNGIPDSYGILIDNISVEEVGKNHNYDACEEMFNVGTKGFRKCIEGEIDLGQECDFSNLSDLHVLYRPGKGVVASRKNVSNAFIDEVSTTGKINFLSLGLRGKVAISCRINGYSASYPVFGKTLELREITWGNQNMQSYPEQAKVRVKLESCDEESLNGVNTIATVQTKEKLTYSFSENEEGKSYSGCRLKKLVVKDVTPKGPSKDGFDLNSVKFVD
ncbi:hypothetical protein A9Q84_06560 [Halobacteriovorax marinus]|uniref:Uncharacterized protein n=1 Tax=Halobacteriovorax marinus TaxID=97084 RepID=A0A1Y5FG89_9BACT|nr:hypothetical protein A9Q84_06560 [Halobacteriovorax marinus]